MDPVEVKMNITVFKLQPVREQMSADWLYRSKCYEFLKI